MFKKWHHWLYLIAVADFVANLAANNLNVLGTPIQAGTASGQVTTLPTWYTSTVGLWDDNLPVQLWLVAGIGAAVTHYHKL